MSFFRGSDLPAVLVPENAVPTPIGTENDDLSLREAVRIVRKRKNLILWTVAGCLALALVLSFVLRPVYGSTATIEIQKDDSGSLDAALSTIASSVGGGASDTKLDIDTQVAILQSDDLGIETIERTGFEKHNGSYWHPFGNERVAAEKGLPLKNAPKERETLLKRFEKKLIVTPIPDTRLITIEFEDPDPKFAASTVNTLVDQYMQDVMARRNSSTIQASQWMSSQLADLNKQVEEAQQKLIDYEKQSGLIAIPSMAPAGGQSAASAVPMVHVPALDRLVALNQDLVTAQAARVTRDAIYHLAKSGDLNALTSLAAESMISSSGDQTSVGMFNSLQALRAKQSDLKTQTASALQIYGAKNPHLIDLDRQMGDLDKQIHQELQLIVDRTALDVDMAKKTEDGIRSAYQAAEKEADKVNDSQIRLAVLQQEADSTRLLYETLYGRLEATKLDEGIKSTNVAIISTGLAPAKAAYPDPLLDSAIGIGAGLFLGLIMAFVVENLDDSVGTSDEAEELTGVPVLGLIPRISESQRLLPKKARERANGNGLGDRSLAELVQGDPRANEAFRSLRTTLLLSQPGSAPKSLLVTSALAGEGKSTTTYSLGKCFAQLGTRVLVVDADLRRPSIHRQANCSNTGGLSQILTSMADPREFFYRDPNIPNLDVLCAGPVPPNPSELLGSSVFNNLLEKFIGMYDLVLIDSPPTMLVSDSVILSAKVDGVVLVARSGSITRAALSKTVEVLRRNKAPLRGIVLNAVNTNSPEYYYSNGYYGSEHYGSKNDA